jgi:hypothetical protein
MVANVDFASGSLHILGVEIVADLLEQRATSIF